MFNYSPGDEIYIFGFSRGAYTARSFVGLLNACGVIMRSKASIIDYAIDLYKKRPDDKNPAEVEYYEEELFTFRAENSPYVVRSDEEAARRGRITSMSDYPRLRINYLGVWDTVGALGIPARYWWSSRINKKHLFHNVRLSSFVKSARHAVAIDERRLDFAPTLWENLDDMNIAAGKKPEAEDAPYQEKWFASVHSSIGGGGDRRGLSDLALEWVLTGARLAGLVFDPDGFSRVYEFKPNYRDHLECSKEPGVIYNTMSWIGADRKPGPKGIHQVSWSARRRWMENPTKLAGASGNYQDRLME